MKVEPSSSVWAGWEAKLGHVFRTLTPYALYPIDGDFQRRVPGGARPCLPRSTDTGAGGQHCGHPWQMAGGDNSTETACR